MTGPRFVSLYLPHVATATTSGDEAENPSPEPKQEDGAFVEVLS